MICCGIGAVAVAAAVTRRRWSKPAGARTSLAATLAVVAASITLLALGAQHFGHYVGRARANERSLVAEIMAQPICTGRPDSRLGKERI
jgi:hypothetical protein